MMDIGIDGRMDKGATVNVGAVQNDTLRSARFRLEREAHWRQLDELVTRAEKGAQPRSAMMRSAILPTDTGRR